jgi:hypothetical protein
LLYQIKDFLLSIFLIVCHVSVVATGHIYFVLSMIPLTVINVYIQVRI